LSEQTKDVTVERDLKIGIVNVLSGEYLDFTKENFTTSENLSSVLFASFAWPGLFPPA
jgi:predicted acylesterase/phospholipase RssA